MTGFVGAYGRSRKAGAAHVAALESAAHDMLDRKLGRSGEGHPTREEVPESAAALWLNAQTECGLPDGAWFGGGSFEITPPHLSLLRQAHFSWDGAERGGPMLDPQRPYGRTDLLAQLAEVFGSDDAEELARRHVEMYFVIARALKHGALTPGWYVLGNIGAADVREAMRGYDGVTDADLGLDADGRVTATDDHVKLLRDIDIRWPSEYDCEDRLEVGDYPAAAADPKRPYGDFTFIEVDMARILGVLPPPKGGRDLRSEPGASAASSAAALTDAGRHAGVRRAGSALPGHVWPRHRWLGRGVPARTDAKCRDTPRIWDNLRLLAAVNYTHLEAFDVAATTPPSTSRSVPVMNDASGPSRKAAAAAMSAGVPRRFAGEAVIMARIPSPNGEASSERPIGVEMMPGLMELIRALC